MCMFVGLYSLAGELLFFCFDRVVLFDAVLWISLRGVPEYLENGVKEDREIEGLLAKLTE